jgi:hypothetical protein
MIAAIFDPDFEARSIGLGGLPGLVSRARDGPPLPSGVLGMGVGMSSSSQMDNLISSHTNTPDGCYT